MRPLLATLVILFAAQSACAAPTVITADDTQVCWTAPATNVDGSPVADGAGFWVYWADVSNGQSDLQRHQVAGWGRSCEQFTNLPGLLRTHIFIKVTAYDTSGNESAWSNEAVRQFGNAGEVPGAASGVDSQ